MALIDATSLVGIFLLSYLASFVLLAILRIVTGISIQRIGYFSLRHISYTLKEGFRIDLRGLGLSLHRPTFAQPTWVSLVFTELKITIDPATLDHGTNKGSTPALSAVSGNSQEEVKRSKKRGRSLLWKRLTNIKEKIKRMHRRIRWLRMLDISATSACVEVVGVGSLQLASLTMAVHTRRKLLDRGRLFRHKKDPLGDQKPAEWIFTVKSVLLAVGGAEPVEILDNMTVNIHGLLYKDREGLRDTSIALKAGRIYIPVDDVLKFNTDFKRLRSIPQTEKVLSPTEEISFEDVVEELEIPGSRESSIVQTVADSKEFFSSILHSVQEIQLGMSFIRISKEVESLRQANLPLIANIVTHEIGIDLHRLDQNSPAHRMYFTRDDVAHQALVAAVSISVSLDEDDSRTSKIIYIPMATTTIRTTLPAKTMTINQERDVEERNTNVLFANLVMTSPSVDLVPQHLIRLLALTNSIPKRPAKTPRGNRHHLISRLLPKASIKFSIHEPVMRFVLPVANPENTKPGDYDMIISAISSVSLDVESSHSSRGQMQYSLASNFRVMAHQLYYQAASGIKHNLVVSEALELKIQVTAATEVHVVVHGLLRTFSVLMVREEVTQGIYNIVRHFKRNVQPDKLDEVPRKTKEAFLRRLPSWLLEFQFEGYDCSIETAGIDKNISKQTRGVALELESWTAFYRSQRIEKITSPSARRKMSTSVRTEETFSAMRHLSPPSSPPRRSGGNTTDGRRLTIHVKGMEGFIIESLDMWEPNPFISLRRFEVAFSTARDLQGLVFHVHAAIRAIYLEFSLYRFYSVGVAASAIQDAFVGPQTADDAKTTISPPNKNSSHEIHGAPTSYGGELFTIDVKSNYIQVKANLPSDPPMLLQIYELSAGRHRWSAPFLGAHLVRLHAESPHLKNVWARLVSLNNLRVDLRKARKKGHGGFVDERSIDVSTDFIRFGVPHGLRVYKVFDNFTNTFKSIQQLRHRFQTRSNEYILKKAPEEPKKVPRISLRCKALMFELEDDPFEWKLGTIYHVGRIEQKQRLARADAYRLKVKKLDENGRRTSSKNRAQSSRRASPGRVRPDRRARSQDTMQRERSASRGRPRRGSAGLRYDREGVCELSSEAKVAADEVWQKLQEHNARSWKKRIDWMMLLQNNSVKNIRRMFSGADEPPHDSDDHETVLGIPNRPGLMSMVISDLHLVIDKPSFPSQDLPKFLHDIGKGMPYDMEYALLIPMSIALDMGEARVMLRDYPLNLLHIPAIRPGQPPRLPSWSLRTDFVIAEEFRGDESHRHVKVDIIPKGQQAEDGTELPGFAIDVRRTVSPVKTYSRPTVDINTSLPTTMSWGTSYQPVIQDMMMIIEGFTKPEIDSSDRVGFWDKIRLSFHSRLVVNWKGEGDVQLRLKGSRDPYIVTGYGAGFVMCWRNEVRLSVHPGDDPRNFMSVRSGDYVLAIPDYGHEARNSLEQRMAREDDASSNNSATKNSAIFKKVIMKVSGNVQWNAGLVFERDLADGHRSSDFEPHYNVILRNPKQMSPDDLRDYDAFRGFRSQFIHLSIALAAPFDRDWTSSDTKPSESYNSVHLTPRFFSHFFDWWSTFSGVMSLPIRQGPLWRGLEKKSKKFGRHLATIKYNLLLSPLFMSHVYKHKDAEDYQEDVVSATGLKLRLDSFMLDLHQRREYFNILSKGTSKQMRTSAMKINRAELDFVRADLRAVAASIAGTSADDLRRASDEMLSSYQDLGSNVDMSQFTIPDNDFSWIDMDDFVELDWVLPAESNPETKILPLAFTPRFTYFRQTDHGDSIQGDSSRTSPFGDEDTHFCVMSHHNDPRTVQMALIKARLHDLEQKLLDHTRLLGEHELLVIREGDQDKSLKQHLDTLQLQQRELESKRKFLTQGLRRLSGQHNPGEMNGKSHSPDRQEKVVDENGDGSGKSVNSPVDIDGLFSAPHDEFASDFNNRFIVHNAQIKWNNSLRNIILRYSHQVSQRRGFVYYMSRRAVKFILDIVDEQSKAKTNQRRSELNVPPTPTVISPTEEKDEEMIVEDRIQQLLNDAQRFVDVKDQGVEEADREDRPSTADFGDKIAEEFQPQNSYHARLIAPQIQLQSEKNTKSVVLVSAKGMELKVVSIMDKERMLDDVSGLVQRRFALDMDGAQFFVTSQKSLAKYLHLYAGNRYGNTPGSHWPPWVSLEAMFDFNLDPFGFQRVIQKTSASLRYEKYNALRLKYNEEVASAEDGKIKHSQRNESRIDHLWVDFPRVRANCDSAQYYAMYIIVLDLLMYSEPLEKTRNERLEKIMLATDFSDLRGAPEMAERLQDRIRQLEDIKLHFQINARYLDKQGWDDRINLEKDLASCEDELFFIMKAINTSQHKNDDRGNSQSSGLLRWYLSASEVVWHLMRDQDEPLLQFQLGNAAYERIDNTDGSNHNAVVVEHIRGWNLLPNALYPEIIAPYHESTQRRPSIVDHQKMLQVHWYMLEAIAGIPVLEQFQVTMFPLKVQLESELSKKLFEYIFPGAGSNAFESGNFSPLMVKNMEPLEEDEELSTESRDLMGSEQGHTVPTDDPHRHNSPGSILRRLKPTYNLNYTANSNATGKGSSKTFIGSHHEGHSRFFKHANLSQPVASNPPELNRKTSASSLRSFKKAREGSSTSLTALKSAEEKKRGTSKERRLTTKRSKKEKPSDDISQMLTRASNYMTLAHVKLDSFVICLSYKGKSDRNFEDLHDFVFKMPTLEYRNKTWSNLDLALRLKKDVIRALISHTGAIIGNKFTHHKPVKKQADRLREIASSSTIIGNSTSENFTSTGTSENTSVYSFSQNDDDADSSRNSIYPSMDPNSAAPLIRTVSWASSTDLSSTPPRSVPMDDPLGTIRPSTGIPHTRGLLKDGFGRHFSGDTVRGKVHLGGLSLIRSDTTRENGEIDESDPETHKKKSMLLLGKKVLGKLG